MPIIKSAKKRVRTAKKATVRNAKTKRNLRSALKTLQSSIDGKKKTASEDFNKVQSALDTAAKKNIWTKNKVARKKRQLAAQMKAAGAKPATTPKKTAAKLAAKKPAAKKAPAKKSTPKKSTKK